MKKTQICNYDALALAIIVFMQSIAYAFVPVSNNTTYFSKQYKRFNNSTIHTVTHQSTNRLLSSSPHPQDALYNSQFHEREESSSYVRLAMPGGPDQPEVQSFTPITSDEMVDPFTGDFSYNIPLLDIDGYPINLGYNAGVTMEQEASWVGLGWNINPGVINRHMRGIPDDFNGVDQIKQEFNQKPNWTVGVDLGINYEIFSFDIDQNDEQDTGGINLSAKLGIEYNNYMGYNSDFSFGPSLGIAKKVGFDIGLQFTGSSQGGASIGANAGFSIAKGAGKSSLNVASSYNSRQGLQDLTVNLNYTHNFKNAYYKHLIKNNKEIKPDKSYHEKINVGGASFNFGMPTHVAQIPFDTKANSFTARFKLGFDIVGNDAAAMFSGFFSKSSLISNSKSLSAFGYMYLQNGQKNPLAMLDFNRENEAPFTANTPALPIPVLTYDLFSVSGHGVGGSYRLDRQDIGYVFDPLKVSSSNSFTVGGEVGLGVTFKAGVDVGGAFTNGFSGIWIDGNEASRVVGYKSTSNYFREANELAYDGDNTHFENIGGVTPVHFDLIKDKKVTSKLLGSNLEPRMLINAKSLSFRRNQPLTELTVKELKNGYGPTRLPSEAYANEAPLIDHHIGGFTVTKTDGSRYFYGLPAYSIKQKNVSFAVGDGKEDGITPADWNYPTITYSGTDASISNNRGLDNYYNSQTIPSYAHSYLLTAVLGPNYVDSDETPGPSPGDLGSYVEFKYKQVKDYRWRNPIEKSTAFYSRGLATDLTDDKANYIYGEKELWYLDTIKTKNHIAIFYKSTRKDAISVIDEDGGINTNAAKMLKLDSIKLFSYPDIKLNGNNATPIKTVHFRYTYHLCQKYPGNVDANSSDSLISGKLTLVKVFFSYEKSYKGEKNGYVFTYGFNPKYHPNNVDRWGYYKENPAYLVEDYRDSDLSNSDFPYVGSNKAQVDLWASAWNLKSIKLPSGGRIEVFYESDDYAYVQYKQAKQMFKIVDVEGCDDYKCSLSDDDNKNRKIFVEKLPNTQVSNYGVNGDTIYFKALLSMNKGLGKYDFVPGYAIIKNITEENGLICLLLEPGALKKENSKVYNPICISGIQFARNYLQRIIPPSNQENPQSEGADFLDIAWSILGIFSSYGEFFTGPNIPLWKKEIGTVLLKNKSWVRLNNPNFRKLGGGHRVKEIRTYDAWDEMTPSGQEHFYGQQYEYVFKGKSSGVASYEPQIGGDENPWRNYVANDISLTWAVDIRNYMETPFGEQFFPSPIVGYSKVLIRNIKREGVKKTATGHVIKEYYTAKDFPTIARRSNIDLEKRKFNLNLFLFSKQENHMTASQGFVVENNDMHGKPKSVEVYGEGQNTPISSINYKYKSNSIMIDNTSVREVVNEMDAIFPDGSVKKINIGRTYEAVADFRRNQSKMKSGNIGLNLNYTVPFVFVPMIVGANYSSSHTEFKSAVFVKTIERKGILYETEIKDGYSTVSTENLLLDAETGEVLLTSVKNNFDDKVYHFTYPAYWLYSRMGQAYKNLGYTSNVTRYFTNGYNSDFNNQILYEGDELILVQSGNLLKAWVVESNNLGVRILKKDGTPIQGAITYLKVIRSGNRNLQSESMGTITLMKNPLNSLSGNVFDEVISAQSIEYGQNWKTFCECEDVSSTNPYVSGVKGNWNPQTTYLHLSNRTQTFENENTNIRKDGFMESFLPYFRLENGKWKVDKENWTFTSSITEVSPSGQAIQAVDPLERYSSSQIGYNQTLTTVQAVNSKRQQMGFDGFEDYNFNSCSDSHFKLGSSDNLNNDYSHTGKYSLKVSSGSPVIFTRQLNAICDVEDPCDLSKYLDEENAVTIMNSLGITVTYEVLSGNPTPIFEEITGGTQLKFNSSGPYKVLVKLLTQDGCSQVFTLQND